MIVLARIVLWILADPDGLVVPSATSVTHRRIGEPLGGCAGSVPGGLHHEHRRVPA